MSIISTDLPANDDLFGLEDYYDGIAEFLKNCDTPKTMYIQGGWGTGKTTALKHIHRKIMKSYEKYDEQKYPDIENIELNRDENCPYIFFSINTWQFSQFKMKEELPILVFSLFCEKLKMLADKKESDSANEAFKRLASYAKIVGGIAGVAIEKQFGLQGPMTLIGSIIEMFTGEYDIDKKISVTQQIEVLKNIINEKIKEVTGNTRRIIVFIDDLDRLEPRIAVEILESIKNFIDCENCVFVLAVDTEVVYQGIKDKYSGFTDEKGKQFFEKIIQVPFTLPIQAYNKDNYIEKLLKDIFKSDFNEEYAVFYSQIINLFMPNGNPRNIKRAVNLLSLNEKFFAKDDKYNKSRELFRISILICILMQLEYESLFLSSFVPQVVEINTSGSEGENNISDDITFFEEYSVSDIEDERLCKAFSEIISGLRNVIISMKSLINNSADHEEDDNTETDNTFFVDAFKLILSKTVDEKTINSGFGMDRLIRRIENKDYRVIPLDNYSMTAYRFENEIYCEKNGYPNGRARLFADEKSTSLTIYVGDDEDRPNVEWITDSKNNMTDIAAGKVVCGRMFEANEYNGRKFTLSNLVMLGNVKYLNKIIDQYF